MSVVYIAGLILLTAFNFGHTMSEVDRESPRRVGFLFLRRMAVALTWPVSVPAYMALSLIFNEWDPECWPYLRWWKN